MTVLLGAEDDGCIDDVCRPSNTTQLPCCARPGVVERLDGHAVRAEQACEGNLPSCVAPHLTDDAGGHRDRDALFECAGEHRDDSSITGLERDQRPGIERDAAHAGRRFR